MAIPLSINWQRVGALVKARRGSESLRGFAARHHVHPVSLLRVERGQPIKADFYLRLAAALRADPYELGGLQPPVGDVSTST